MKTCILIIILTITLSLVLAQESNLKKFAAGTSEFSDALYNELLVDSTDNFIVSPFSAETILALTQSGAVGTTAQEIRSSLHLPKTEQETEELFKTVLPIFESDDYVVKTANKIYVEDKFEIKETFKSVAADVYQAAFQNVEFAENVGAAEVINKWVEKETNNLIHELVAPNDLDASTILVLVNALYFEANWSSPFEPTLTKQAPFHSPNKKLVNADFMFLESAELNYYESKELEAQILELPFKGSDASMTIILPNKPGGIVALEKQAPNLLESPNYEKKNVQVFLPKFQIDTTIDFIKILKRLGVHAAFDSTADFSGIAGAPGELVISKITQKAFVDVNEGGVHAAAATVVVVDRSGPPPATHHFIADHPFMFYIKVNDIILFEGRVLEPKYE